MSLSNGKMSSADIGQSFKAKKIIKKERVSGPGKNNLAIARVSSIDYEDHTVTLRMLSGADQEFQRVPVSMTYPGAGSRHFLGAMPEEGDLCICGFMNQESDGRTATPVILAWTIPGTMAGYDWLTTQPFAPDEFPLDPKGQFFTKGTYSKIRHKLRHMTPGNIVASSSQGSDLVLNEDVQLSNRRGNEIILRDQDQALVIRACQQFTALSGTRSYSGMVQRDAAIIPSTTISDGIEWDSGRMINSQGDLYTDYELSSVSKGIDSGEYEPHKVFRRRGDDGTWYESNTAGLIIEPSIDPYEFLKKGLMLSDQGIVDKLAYPTAVYGGKYINRVSTAVDSRYAPLNAMFGGIKQSKSYTEHRTEISHTSDGQLPVTEQTDGFDADRLPRSRPDGTDKFNSSSKAPFIESVMGTVVGNDPFSRTGRQLYGLPLAPTIFVGGVAAPAMESAVGLPLEDQAATYFRMSPPLPNGGMDTFWSVTKGGRVLGSIGGKKDNPYSAEFALNSGLKISAGGKITFEAAKGFDFITGNGDSKENLGLNMGSSNGAVKIYGGGKSNTGALAARNSPVGSGESDQPNLTLEGKENVAITSSRKVSIKTGVIESLVSSSSTTSQSGIYFQAGDGFNISSKSYNQITNGKATYGFHGPMDNLPTNGAFRETTFAGIAVGAADKYTVVMGDREEMFMLGNHKTTILVGNFTYETNAGKYSVRAGANTFDVDFASGLSSTMTVGNTSFTNVAGGFSVNAMATVSVRATGTSIVSGTGGVSLGGPGKVGGIVCGSDLDPLTGLPLVTLGMGSPGHSLVVPI